MLMAGSLALRHRGTVDIVLPERHAITWHRHCPPTGHGQHMGTGAQVPAREAVPGLRPKVLLNMGIALEAEGRLQDACKSYRHVEPSADPRHTPAARHMAHSALLASTALIHRMHFRSGLVGIVGCISATLVPAVWPHACQSSEYLPRRTGRSALELAPSHPRLHKLLGSALFATGELNGAEAALRQAIALRADYADAW